MALIALSAKMRIDQIEPLDSIESITDGASSRRNQLLVDLGSELNLGAIDGAAEADLAGLKGQVTKLARTYKPYGPVLSDAINDQLRTVLGPSGKRPAYIAERVKKTWELGDGWVKHVTVEVALGTREGSSVRGGGAGRSARRCARRRGDRRQGHRRRRRGGGRAPGCRGVAAVGCRRRGRRGGLRRAGRVRRTGHRPQRRAGLGGPADPGPARPGQPGQRARGRPTPSSSTWSPPNSVRTGRVWWLRRSTAARRCCSTTAGPAPARTWPSCGCSTRARSTPTGRASRSGSRAPGHVVGTQASWWQGKALAAGRNVHASLYGRAAAGAENPGKGRYTDEVAVVTGASKGSIAASVVAQLLDGGATVIATTSKLDDDRLAFYRTLYRDNARFDAKLWVVPANMASYTDIDALVSWVGTEQTESLGPQSIHLKDAQTPTLLFPFAAPRVAGDLSDAGSRAEMEMKVLLWAVQRLIGGLSHIGAERDIAARLHVVLPGSPNRGMFGGDGAYGEVEVRARRGGVAVEGRVVVGAASFVGARADRLDQGHRADGPQRRDRRCGRGGRRDDVHDRRDGEHAARPVRHRVQGRGGARAAAGRPDRRAGRRRPRSVRAGRQGPRGDDGRGEAEDEARGPRHHPCAAVAAARATRPRRRRRGTTSTSTRPTWW